MKAVNVAILGATGAVGQEILGLLAERDFPIKELRLLASPRSAGKTVEFKGQKFKIRAVAADQFDDIDIAFFCAGGDISKQWAPIAVEAGAVVVDNTSAFRMHKDVPLIVPEVNAPAALNHNGIIANPNCSTIIMVVALKPIYEAVGIKRIVVSTYQAVSGAGYRGMEELEAQAIAYTKGDELEANVLPVGGAPKHYPILMNVIPQIDVPDRGDYTKEEWKMIDETKKIFADDSMRITATAVRVPVLRSHAESINIETDRKLSVEECKQLIAQTPGLRLEDDIANQVYPMPIDTSGQDLIWVGRIREDYSIENGLNLWVVGDQVRKGAALNAIQIAEFLIPNMR